MEYASNAKGNLGVTLGAVGSALGALNSGLGLVGGMNPHGSISNYVTKDELKYVQELAAKDCEIALLKSEQNTEIKIADVYERLITRINADQRAQSDWNTQQMVNNAQMSNAIAVNANSIAALQDVCGKLTKVIIPKDNICPEFMDRFNSWTAPTA